MSQYFSDSPAIIIIAETSNLPIELQDGIAEFVRFCPHKNFQTEDTMRDNDNEYKWNLRSVSSSNYPQALQLRFIHALKKKKKKVAESSVITVIGQLTRIISYRFVYDHLMRPGHLSVSSNFSHYKNLLLNEKFEVVVRYHRKIEGGVHFLLCVFRRKIDY